MKIKITNKENLVLINIAKGFDTYKISKILKISENTVLYHIKNINNKLGAKNRAHAVAIATALNLLDLDQVLICSESDTI